MKKKCKYWQLHFILVWSKKRQNNDVVAAHQFNKYCKQNQAKIEENVMIYLNYKKTVRKRNAYKGLYPNP